jgi:hypothetical protein
MLHQCYTKCYTFLLIINKLSQNVTMLHYFLKQFNFMLVKNKKLNKCNIVTLLHLFASGQRVIPFFNVTPCYTMLHHVTK